MENFRRSQRYRFQLEVRFRGTFRTTSSLTEDVSFHGVFIRTDEVRTPNQLIKFAIVDPHEQEAIELLGIVARCVSPADAGPGRPPGVGVSLFGNDRATEARWVALIRRVRGWAERGLVKAPPPGQPEGPMELRRVGATGPEPGRQTVTPPAVRPAPPPMVTPPPMVGGPPPLVTPPRPPLPSVPPPIVVAGGAVAEPPAAAEPPPPPVAAEPVDAVRRAHVRRPARFNVTLRPAGLDELHNFELKDISEGGTFVITSTLVPVGSLVTLRLVHPSSSETFHIPGQVVRTIDSLDPAEKGLGIRFRAEGVDPELWRRFLERNAPVPPTGLELFPAAARDEGHVRVLRTPATEPPVLLGPSETPAPGAIADDDPGGAPILLGDDEEPVPIILGPGVANPSKPS